MHAKYLSGKCFLARLACKRSPKLSRVGGYIEGCGVAWCKAKDFELGWRELSDRTGLGEPKRPARGRCPRYAHKDEEGWAHAFEGTWGVIEGLGWNRSPDHPIGERRRYAMSVPNTTTLSLYRRGTRLATTVWRGGPLPQGWGRRALGGPYARLAAQRRGAGGCLAPMPHGGRREGRGEGRLV